MDTSKATLLVKGHSDYHASVVKSLFLSCLLFGLLICPTILKAQAPGDAINQEAGFYYTVKKGDTLWDLSERFADSPWLWPDLWKENDQIPNPHWIYPGNRIRLYHKEWTRVMEKPAEEKMGPAKEPIYFLYRNINLLGFIRKEAVKPNAVIFKAKDDLNMLSKDCLVYLRKENSEKFIPGARYTVYRTMNAAVDEATGKPFGVQHVITGVVEIIKEEPDFVLGKITYSLRPIHIKDKLMPLTSHPDQIQVVESVSGMNGRIISAEDQQKIFGDNTVAFIDKGEKDGITAGQIYQLYDQEEAKLRPENKKKIKLTPYVLGEAFVLRTEAETATVIITSSKDPLSDNVKIRSIVQ